MQCEDEEMKGGAGYIESETSQGHSETWKHPGGVFGYTQLGLQ